MRNWGFFVSILVPISIVLGGVLPDKAVSRCTCIDAELQDNYYVYLVLIRGCGIIWIDLSSI